jgi:hypothetical protein
MKSHPSSRVLVIGAVLTFTASCVSPLSAQETQRQYLSGHGKDDAVPWRFFCTTGHQSGYWTNLPVPSNWELHGFGTLSYHKDPTNAWDEKGLYQLDFFMPTQGPGQRGFLVFEGVMTDTSATLNGALVGPIHQGGFYRFKYEVTKLVQFGATNRLEVSVSKHSSNGSVNRAERTADYWVFGGIYRPVYLETAPARCIERVAIDARADGAFTMEVFADGITSADAGMTLEARITDASGKAAGAPFTTPITGGQATLRSQVRTPRQWTAETPNLYSVEVRLKHGTEVLHRCQQRFGFRTMEVREGDGLYVNGRRVILKGANRHSFWPESGRCLSEAIHRLDINLMKDMNMNAVRMSHYPPDAEFLDLCDELGLYVLDELAGWHAAYDTEVGRKLVEEMVTRDVNHPCILFWDNGNEGGFNPTLDARFSDFDPQRRRVLHPWTPFNGVNTSHYLAYDLAAIACTGVPTYYRDGKELADTNDPTKYIYMPTECLHGLFDGGAGAGLEDYWTRMQQSKFLGGAFIWALVDEGLKRPDTGAIDTAGNQAPDGIVGPYREREGSFHTIKELWSPIQVTRNTNGQLLVENRYSFTDANQCRFTWQLRQFPGPFETHTTVRVIGEGVLSAPSIPPGGKGAIPMDLPANWQEADALALRVSDPNGRELWTWVWPLPHLDALPGIVNVSSRRVRIAEETADCITAKIGDLTASISKQTGLLIGVKRGAQKFSLTNGPRPVVGSSKLTRLEKATEGGDVIVTATYEGELRKVIWRLRSDGWVQCDYAYTATGPQPVSGVAFDYPESLVKRKRWLGNGPFRVWKNRFRGGQLGVWENHYNDTITGWRDWVYPEFEGCFAGVRWMQLETTEGLITAVPERRDVFVQVLTPEAPPTNLVGKTAVQLPQAGLAFLHAIPPIGSKFKDAGTSGPQGQPTVAAGEYQGSVRVYFGTPP